MLGVISILAVYSSSGGLAYQEKAGNTGYFLWKQIVFIAVALVTVMAVQFISYKRYEKHALILYGIAIFLLIVTAVAGVEINGAKRWLSIPGIPFNFQPSDLAKISLIVLTSKILAVKRKDGKIAVKSLKQIGIFTGIIVAIVMINDISTALLIVVIVAVLLIIGRIDKKYILISIGVVILGLFILYFTVSNFDIKNRFGTAGNRIESFFDSESGDHHQVDRAKIAIVTGGLIGRGPGNSIQRNILSQSNSDYIFAIIIEEYGLFGATVIIALYLWILYRGIYIAKNCNETFPILLTSGLIVWITGQAFANMMIATDMLPATGQTLPFVSMGGTSIISTAIAFGIILNVSYLTKKKKKKEQLAN